MVFDISESRVHEPIVKWRVYLNSDPNTSTENLIFGYALQALMGHSSLEVLKVYARVEGVDVAAAHQQYGAVASL